MKYKFNDNTLVVGFIKELLHSFNLPTIPVYTDETIAYKDRSYIKGNKIVKYTGSDFKTLSNYTLNKQILNLTKKLTMNSTLYDSYTHKYLGEYLRFIRDYRDLDLMGMYNCFCDESPKNTEYSFSSSRIKFNLDTSDKNFNYYIIPVKFNQVYTIAIDAEIKYELACIFYNKIFLNTTPDDLVVESYKQIGGSKFTKPYIYSTKFNCASKYWRLENNLMLVLKLPKEIDSSITILEGNYMPCSNVVDNSFISDFIYDDDNIPKNFYGKNSLLQYNNKISYPFADRLIEYLTGNAITNLDEFSANIKRVQDSIYKYGFIKGYYGIWSNTLKNDIYKLILEPDITSGSYKFTNSIIEGNIIFDDDSSEGDVSYPESIVFARKFIDIYNDSSGYVDKDVESLLRVL